jgi:riboflavin-specific deaminase-like protein
MKSLPPRVAKAARPFVFLNVALSADGKIAPASRVFVPFGSPRDQEHLYALRARADAVMAGARTVDLMAVKLGPGGARFRRRRLRLGLAEYNLRVVVTGSGTLNPDAEIFKHRFSPILILTSGRAPATRLRVLRARADEVKVCGDKEVDFREALTWLRQRWGVKRLLCEGGGELNAALFRADLVDEVHVTLCPLILGGRLAPTLADGVGITRLADAVPLQLTSRRRLGDELFLTYRVLHRRR